MLQVVSSRDQVLLEEGQQFGIGGRIVRTDIVRRMDNPPAQQPEPDAVDDVPSEPRILGADQPIGKRPARILARRESDGGRVGKGGCPERFHARLAASLLEIEQDDLFLPFDGRLIGNLRKEGGHARPALLGPALRPHSHERERHGLGDGLRLAALHGAVEVHLRVAEVAAAAGEHLADEPVVRHVLLDARANPAVIGLHRVGPEFDGELGLDPQQVAPLHRPVVGELLALQQAIDQLAAFVGVGILQELRRLFSRRERADHVQVGPAHKDAVGAHPSGSDPQLFQPAEDQFVNPASGNRIGVAFKGTDR